jgi:DnaJ-class molecular chaperone
MEGVTMPTCTDCGGTGKIERGRGRGVFETCSRCNGTGEMAAQ